MSRRALLSVLPWPRGPPCHHSCATGASRIAAYAPPATGGFWGKPQTCYPCRHIFSCDHVIVTRHGGAVYWLTAHEAPTGVLSRVADHSFRCRPRDDTGAHRQEALMCHGIEIERRCGPTPERPEQCPAEPPEDGGRHGYCVARGVRSTLLRQLPGHLPARWGRCQHIVGHRDLRSESVVQPSQTATGRQQRRPGRIGTVGPRTRDQRWRRGIGGAALA